MRPMNKFPELELKNEQELFNRLFFRLSIYLDLIKFQLSLFIAISCLWGYLLFQPHFTKQTAITILSVFLLACGAAALNNFQDRLFDRQFSRTFNRPVPSGKISEVVVLKIAGILISLGLIGLGWISRSLLPVLLGMSSLILYNLVYTPLKKRTVLSIFPGALCGMIPPYIGWTVAGGNGFNLTIGAVMLSIGMWQFPHFWLILVKNAPDYSKSQVATMLKLFSQPQLQRILTVWVGALTAIISCLPLIYHFNHQWIFWVISWFGILTLMLFIISSFASLIRIKKLFLFLNVYLLIVMAGMIIDRLVV